MNPDLERPPEQPETTLLAPFQVLEQYEAKASTITLTDDASMDVVMLLIAKIKEVELDIKDERKSLTDPLRAEIERVTQPYKERLDKAEALRDQLTIKLTEYRNEKERQRLLAQQASNGEAEEDRARREADAEAARKNAEQARKKGNEVAAVKLEGQAQRQELAAAQTAPVVHLQQAKTSTLIDGSKMTLTLDKDWLYQCGVPRGESYFRTDRRLQDTPDEYFELNETKIGKVIRAGGTIPGIRMIEKPRTTSRKAKA